MSDVKIYVGMPIYERNYPVNTISLIKLGVWAAERKMPMQFDFDYRDCVMHRARNRILNRFMATDFTHYLSVESDVGFDPDYVEEMLAADADIVGCPEAMKHMDPERTHNVWPLPGSAPVEPDKPFPVRHTTLGFTLIRRSVFDAMATYGEYFIEGGERFTYYTNFATDLAAHRLLDEAELLGWRAHAKGLKVVILPWCTTSQQGVHHFNLCYLCSIKAPHSHKEST